MWKSLCFGLACVVILSAQPAGAQELNDFFPAPIPGYGTVFAVSPPPATRAEPTGLPFGPLLATPRLSLNLGYDSAPNNAAASTLATASPSLSLADAAAGFGAFAAANATAYPQNTSQNSNGASAGLGERLVLPSQTITLAGAILRGDVTGFALDTIAAQTPVAFAARNLRAGDDIAAGMFTLSPAISVTQSSFAGDAQQNHQDAQAALTTKFSPPGPIQAVLRLQFTQTRYRQSALNASNAQILAGLTDTADGLWTVSALAGAARRTPRTGPATTGPVLEARADWRPTLRDQLSLSALREIDDPDDISATPYTLTQAKLAFAHSLSPRLTASLAASASNAAFLGSQQRETLLATQLGCAWAVNTALSLTTAYQFNDRQANFLRAANEHVVTIGLTWTP